MCSIQVCTVILCYISNSKFTIKSCLKLDFTKCFRKQKCGLWDCETCIADMSQFGQVMSSEPFAQKVVNELNGDLLCEDPNLALDGDQIRDCKIFTKTFVPIALQQLFNVESKTVYPEMWCKEIFDIC